MIMSFCNFKTTDKSDDDEEDLIFDESFSSDYNEFRTNSSSSSIKWSVDARRQNEEDWLSIERILYGEESLPEGSVDIVPDYRSDFDFHLFYYR